MLLVYTYLGYFSSLFGGIPKQWVPCALPKALPVLWAPYLFLTWTLYSLNSTQTLPQDILLGVFFLSHPPYFSCSSYSWIFIVSVQLTTCGSWCIFYCSSWHMKLIPYGSLPHKLSIFFQISVEDVPFSTCIYLLILSLQFLLYNPSILLLNCIKYLGIHDILKKII